MRNAQVDTWRRHGGSVGVAVRSYLDRVHRVSTVRPDRHLHVAACGRQVALIDNPAGLTECRQCWPTSVHTGGLMALWDICDDLDERYNATIRDDRPLGAPLEWPRQPRAS